MTAIIVTMILVIMLTIAVITSLVIIQAAISSEPEVAPVWDSFLCRPQIGVSRVEGLGFRLWGYRFRI